MAFQRALLIFGAALFIGNASGASAADLGTYEGSLKDAPYVAESASPAWYFRLDGGYAAYDANSVFIEGFTDSPGFISDSLDVDNGWSIGGGIGKRFGNWRADVTLEHRFNTDIEGTVEACCTATVATNFNSTVGLLNVYYDFNRGGRITPYLGAGIGFAYTKTSVGDVDMVCGACTFLGYSESATKTNFAAAAMAGLSVKLRGGETHYMGGIKDGPVAVSSDRALFLDVGYRFLYLGDVKSGNMVFNSLELDPQWDDLTAHEARVGLRYELN
jgi:opacity protein-like surface antigen